MMDVNAIAKCRAAPLSLSSRHADVRPRRMRIAAGAGTSAGEGGAAIVKRREVLDAGLLCAAAAAQIPFGPGVGAARAEEADLDVFWGAANPPATYGGTARTTQKFARYSFNYPNGWKEEAINKVEKGTNGTDCRLVGSKRNQEKIYVVVLSRLGEDFKGYKSDDVEKALSGIAVADATLQDVLTSVEDKTFTKRTVDGQTFFDLNLESSPTYLVTLTNDGAGRYFACFVVASNKAFSEQKETYLKMRDSFRTYVIA